MVSSLARKNLYETPGISSPNTTESVMHTNILMAAEQEKDSIREDKFCQLKSQFEQQYKNCTNGRYLRGCHKNACMKLEKASKDL
jgi:hypothetical protein